MWQYLKKMQFQSFINVITAGRLKCCGIKDLTVVAHGCWKKICGMEGKNVVDCCRLPSPAHSIVFNLITKK